MKSITKNTTLDTRSKDAREDFQIVKDFDIVSWCEHAGVKYTEETAQTEIKDAAGNVIETRKATYLFPDVFALANGNRNTVDAAYAATMDFAEQYTQGNDVQKAILVLVLKWLNTTTKNNLRATLQEKKKQENLLKIAEATLTELVDQQVKAAASGNMEAMQEIAAKMAATSAEIKRLKQEKAEKAAERKAAKAAKAATETA